MDNILYTEDFFTWTQQQAELLSKRHFEQLDLEHLVEEIQDLGNRHYDQLESCLMVLVAHLLKWQVQHWKRTNSWRATIRVQRTSLAKLLRRNPGLKSRLEEAIAESWQEARDLAIAEADLPDDQFPNDCPFTISEVLDANFWPNHEVSYDK
ncbi:MAG: DUF29 domain-containing protein [Microcystaceae cyanobacterium]